MKKAVSTISSFLFVLLFASCSTCQMVGKEKLYGLDTMLDYYYFHFGDYPSLLDELIAFSDLKLYDSSFLDSANMTIQCLKQNRDEIIWQFDDAFPNSHLLIINNNDTIAYRVNDNRFPSLDGFIYSYTDCYGELPFTASDLIAFRKAALKATRYMQYWQYDSLTIRNLQKCQDMGILYWSVVGKELIITVNDDVIADWSDNTQQNGFCYTLPKEVYYFSPRFFDSNGVYVFCDKIIYDDFRHHIRDLYHKELDKTDNEMGQWGILQYTRDKGLESLCSDVNLSINNAWNKMVFEYVSLFAEKNNYSKIIFSCPCFK